MTRRSRSVRIGVPVSIPNTPMFVIVIVRVAAFATATHDFTDAQLEALVNVRGQGRCSITLDPKDRFPGQQPYQGVVSLHGDQREPLQKISEVLEHYMLQSEQLDTRLILAANDEVAAGLTGPAAGATGASGGSSPTGPSGGDAVTAFATGGYLPTTIGLRAQELQAGSRRLSRVVAGISQDGSVWRVNLDADQASGYIEYRAPRGPAGNAPAATAGRVYARLSRLSLPKDDVADVENLLGLLDRHLSTSLFVSHHFGLVWIGVILDLCSLQYSGSAMTGTTAGTKNNTTGAVTSAETGPAGTVIFVPPFRDPFNHVYDPLVINGVQALGTFSITLTSFGICFGIFKLVDLIVGLRATDTEQIDGLDFAEHAANAYPDFQTTEQA